MAADRPTRAVLVALVVLVVLLALAVGMALGARFERHGSASCSVSDGARDTARSERSWGDDFAGGCFEVLETGRAGCGPSYADETTVTLRVR